MAGIISSFVSLMPSDRTSDKMMAFFSSECKLQSFIWHFSINPVFRFIASFKKGTAYLECY